MTPEHKQSPTGLYFVFVDRIRTKRGIEENVGEAVSRQFKDGSAPILYPDYETAMLAVDYIKRQRKENAKWQAHLTEDVFAIPVDHECTVESDGSCSWTTEQQMYDKKAWRKEINAFVERKIQDNKIRACELPTGAPGSLEDLHHRV